MTKTIFILDDEKEIRKALRVVLEDEGYIVEDFANSKSLFKSLAKEEPSLLLLDVWVGKEDGLLILDECKKSFPNLPIVMISGHGTIELAVNATKKGAIDFLEKPLSIEKVIQTIESSLERIQLNESRQSLLEIEKDLIIGSSQEIIRIKQIVEQASDTKSTVFLFGENGTGKKITAKTIHDKSKRALKPFVEFNCVSYPEDQIEIELFGRDKSNGSDEKIGAIERANLGTLFLDEVCDLPLSCQLKLQRTIQEGKLERIGSEESIILDVRILSATNLNIDDVLADGKFRRELFYLLNVVPISLPPLRERAEDIPALTNHYLERFSQENETKPKIIEPDAMDVLTNHFWPGNIRELKNILERLSILVPGETITAKDVKEALLGFKKANEMVARGDLKHAKEEFERQYIIKTMQVCEGNVTRASKVLGIERTHLYRKLKSLNINVDQMGEASA